MARFLFLDGDFRIERDEVQVEPAQIFVAHAQCVGEMVAGIEEQDFVAQSELEEHVHEHGRGSLHAGEQDEVLAEPACRPADAFQRGEGVQEEVCFLPWVACLVIHGP